jgi:hypothetical protein
MGSATEHGPEACLGRDSVAPVATIETATVQDLKRLLELFPIVTLRSEWPAYKGTKEEIGSQRARSVTASVSCAL